MAIKIDIDFEGLPRGLNPQVVQRIIGDEVVTAVNRTTIKIKEAQVQDSPFGGTALLKQSWQLTPAKRMGTRITGSVNSDNVAAAVIDEGARPHFPPVGSRKETPALGVWIRRKLGIENPDQIRQVAFGIGRKFRRAGIPARKIFTRNFLVIGLQTLRAEMARLVDRVKKRLG